MLQNTFEYSCCDVPNCFIMFIDTEASHLYSLKPHNLQSVVKAGCSSLGAKSAHEEQLEIESNPLFHKFLNAVSAKGYFKGTIEGDEEHTIRYRKMVARFKEKLKAQAQAQTSSAAPPGSQPQSESSSGREAEAEALKEEGNNLLKQKDYAGATEAYTKAIQVHHHTHNYR